MHSVVGEAESKMTECLTLVTVPAYEPPKEPSSAMRESVIVGSPEVLIGSSALKVKSDD